MGARFPLIMPNEVKVKSIAELKENFDICAVLDYYSNGKLLRWLEDRYYSTEAEKIRALKDRELSSEELGREICGIFGVECAVESIDITQIERESKKLSTLKQLTDDPQILKNADSTAIAQEDLEGIQRRFRKGLRIRRTENRSRKSA